MTPEMKKQTVFIRHSDYDSERVENVYVLTPEDLLALRRKWAGEGFDAGREWGDEFLYRVERGVVNQTIPDKETYLNNLTID